MKYKASNGVTAPVELTEEQARADYERAPYVTGTFGGRFVICPIGEMGHLLTVAATTYTPVPDAAGRPGRASWWRFWSRWRRAR